MIFWAKYEPISAQQSPNWIQGKTNAVLYLPLHIPSASEQSKQILAESKQIQANPSKSKQILVNSNHIPTEKKQRSKSHSESFQPTGRNQKIIFFTKSESKFPTKFQVDSECIPMTFWAFPAPQFQKIYSLQVKFLMLFPAFIINIDSNFNVIFIRRHE
jgi:hypothetical protein